MVCPECGTPYHRDCYKKEGRCINDELHSKHMSWKAEVEEKEQADGLKCSVCGNTLRNDQLFCDKCGTPTPYYLSQKDKADGEEQESFSNGDTFFNNAEQNAMETMYPYILNYSDPLCGFSPDEKYDEDMTTKDIADFIGSNTRFYLPKFRVMKATKFKLSFNIPAMLFPEFYFAYRKMPLLAFLVLHEAIPDNMLAGIACILCGSLVSILPGLLAQRRAAAHPFAEDTVKEEIEI